jgi:endonuclease G
MFNVWGRFAAVVAVALALAAPALAAEGDEHVVMGNPTGAVTDASKPNNYLVRKRQYVLSYNNSTGTANWTSWHLSKKWLGNTRRNNPFAPDPSLPQGFFVVRPNDYRGAGFDRGHLCPAADRSVSARDMDATFAMSNMVPQAPRLNRIVWEKLESYCRDQVRQRDQELYIVAGPWGQGGTGEKGAADFIRGRDGKITVPARCWKVVLIVPAGLTDPRRVTAEARAFAVVMPNDQDVATDWRQHAVTVGEVEKLTGYTFFSTIPTAVAKELKTRKDTRARPTRESGVLPRFVQGCVIGNSKSKIFHVPGGAGYERAKGSANAIFFKDQEAAQKAGYRKAKR